MRVRKEEEQVIYIEPEMEIVRFETVDVITESVIDNKPIGTPDIGF